MCLKKKRFKNNVYDVDEEYDQCYRRMGTGCCQEVGNYLVIFTT